MFNLVAVVVGLLLSAATGYYLWSESGRVGLDLDGQAITNASELLASSEALLGETAAADEVQLPADARCYFAPDERSDPTIVCGPVWLGRSPIDSPWLEMDLRYVTADGGVTGELRGVDGAVAADHRTFRRPDGAEAEAPGPAIRPPDALRVRSGSRLIDADELLARAETQVMAFLAEQQDRDTPSVAMADGWRCYLIQGPDRVWDSPVVDDRAYCGPARTSQSRSSEVWLPVLLRLTGGPAWGSVELDRAEVSSRGLRSIADDATLVTADGGVPPPVNREDIDRPPVSPDFLTTVSYPLPVESGVAASLTTRNARLVFDGLDRVKTIGAGSRSFTAPDGHDLVVASLAPSDDRPSIRATVVVDGALVELPRLPSIPDGGSIVLAVPESARTVDLVVENDGRPQTMSLLDGTLSPGFPLALYRPRVSPAAALGTRIEMPAGEAVVVTGTLDRVLWRAWDEDEEWLPEGVGHLLLRVEDWQVNEPCCDVDIQSVDPTFTLVAEQEFVDRRENPTDMSSRAPSPRFEVPEDLAQVTVRIEVVVTFTVDDQTRTATEVVEVDLALP